MTYGIPDKLISGQDLQPLLLCAKSKRDVRHHANPAIGISINGVVNSGHVVRGANLGSSGTLCDTINVRREWRAGDVRRLEFGVALRRSLMETS